MPRFLALLAFFVASALGLDYSSLVRLNASCFPRDTCSAPRDLDHPSRHSCDCSALCSLHNTCCIDAPARQLRGARDLRRLSCRPTTHQQSFFMQGVCGGEHPLARRCESDSKDWADPFANVPVTNVASHTTYKNVFCALCNGEYVRNLTFWQVSWDCAGLRDDMALCHQDRDFVLRNLVYVQDKAQWGVHLFVGAEWQFQPLLPSVRVPAFAAPAIHPCRLDLVSECHPDWQDGVPRTGMKDNSGTASYPELGGDEDDIDDNVADKRVASYPLHATTEVQGKDDNVDDKRVASYPLHATTEVQGKDDNVDDKRVASYPLHATTVVQGNDDYVADKRVASYPLSAATEVQGNDDYVADKRVASYPLSAATEVQGNDDYVADKRVAIYPLRSASEVQGNDHDVDDKRVASYPLRSASEIQGNDDDGDKHVDGYDYNIGDNDAVPLSDEEDVLKAKEDLNDLLRIFWKWTISMASLKSTEIPLKDDSRDVRTEIASRSAFIRSNSKEQPLRLRKNLNFHSSVVRNLTEVASKTSFNRSSSEEQPLRLKEHLNSSVVRNLTEFTSSSPINEINSLLFDSMRENQKGGSKTFMNLTEVTSQYPVHRSRTAENPLRFRIAEKSRTVLEGSDVTASSNPKTRVRAPRGLGMSVSEACRVYMGVVHSASATYRNVHCAICNFEEPDGLMCDGREGVEFKGAVLNFGMLLDIDLRDGERVGGADVCVGEGQVFDPFAKKCRTLECGLPGYVLEEGKCVRRG